MYYTIHYTYYINKNNNSVSSYTVPYNVTSRSIITCKYYLAAAPAHCSRLT